MKIIDTCGLLCPQPVLLTKKRLETDNMPIEVLVDSNAALENITRMAEQKGYKVSVTNENNTNKLLIEKL